MSSSRRRGWREPAGRGADRARPRAATGSCHYWELLEEKLAGDPHPAPVDAEIEFREPADAGDAVVLRSGDAIWISSPAQAVHASILRW